MSVVLRLDSIGKRFGDRAVLSGAYLEARAGEVTALVGRNGAGKSTLLKIASGRLRADHGFVELLGERVLRPRHAELAGRGLFFLPADEPLLAPGLTLGQHLGALEWRFGASPQRAAVLERLGVADLVDERCGALSGGERRRAELVVAWLRRPLCLLADEPLRGIDPKEQELLVSAFRALAAEGCAVVATGHEVNWMLAMGDRFVWLREGGTELLGDRAAAERHWGFRRSYLGPVG